MKRVYRLTGGVATVCVDLGHEAVRTDQKGTSTAWRELIIKVVEAGGLTAIAQTMASLLSRCKRVDVEITVNQNTFRGQVTHEEQSALMEWFKTQSGLSIRSPRGAEPGRG